MNAGTAINNIYVPFSRSDYQLNNVLSAEEREALSTGHKRTSALSQQGPLSSLLRPLQDIADRSGTSDRLVRIILPAVLAEIHRTGQPCWLWGSEKWLTLCQQHRSGRPLIAALAHMISVLIDHDPAAASLTGPAIYYELGDSYCTNPFWSSCPHRMACIGCDFNLPKKSARGLLLESKASIKQYLEEVPLTPDEKAIVEADTEKLEAALRKTE